MRRIALLGAILAAASVRAQQPELPVFGDANPDNHYETRYTEVYRFDFESPASDFTVATSTVSITSDPAEVISGKFSMKIVGAQASVGIRQEALKLQPGRIYLLQYDYRVIASGQPYQAIRAIFTIAGGSAPGNPVM